MADAAKTLGAKTPEEKKLHEKKKEFRQLRERLKALRESAKKTTEERKQVEARVREMAGELGIELKGKKSA